MAHQYATLGLVLTAIPGSLSYGLLSAFGASPSASLVLSGLFVFALFIHFAQKTDQAAELRADTQRRARRVDSEERKALREAILKYRDDASLHLQPRFLAESDRWDGERWTDAYFRWKELQDRSFDAARARELADGIQWGRYGLSERQVRARRAAIRR